jgi:hypothetical protein
MRRRTPQNEKFPTLCIACVLALILVLSASVRGQDPENNSASQSPSAEAGGLPRGQKLFLKDGTFQLVREYKIDGDRVSYYSLDTHEWEEMPASMIDWDATRKEATQESSKDAALVTAVDSREKAQHAEVLTVDASIEPAPGVFLPPDVGLFAFDGKAIITAKQAEMNSTMNKSRMVAKVLLPIPVIPTRHLISIAGTRAALRMSNAQPEFYMRTEGGEPEIDLVQAKVHGKERQVENVDELMGETAASRKTVALQRWKLAENVYRYTVATPLAPGEYVLVQSIPTDEKSIYLWDFEIEPAR